MKTTITDEDAGSSHQARRMTMERIHPVVLLVLCLFARAPHGLAADDEMIFTQNGGSMTLTGLNSQFSGGLLVIPATANGLPVTTIGGSAFAGTSVTSVAIPDSVTDIGPGAFQGCTSLTNVAIPGSVTNISATAFAGCRQLRDIALPGGLTHMGDDAFFGCVSLTRIAIPNSVTTVGIGAFSQCSGLSNVTLSENLISVSSGLFSCCSNLTGVAIPASVTRIGYQAFYYCTNLTNLDIANGLANIDNYAFFGCSRLPSVTLPASLGSIGDGAFAWCTSLMSITVAPQNPAFSSVDGVLFNKDQSKLIEYPAGKAGNYVVPGSVTTIGPQAFYGCTNLMNITIGDTVTGVGDYAFEWCSCLTTAIVGSSVTNLGDGTFYLCMSLRGIYFEGEPPITGPWTFFGWGEQSPTIYYLPGTVGWSATLRNIPTAPWTLANPRILTFGPSFGVQTNQFGFIISWATNRPVVVDACTNLANPVWSPVKTNNLANGWSYFSDRNWKDHRRRFYRLRAP